ncbi:AMP-binding protein [Microbacterium sp.]|uniref:AMP-binding protein n=1 Tax=Microbacterium sp. TaxID=51671 RepID=UPI002630D9F4|nr:AMP-binding protein [Microbacterium sp.]
MRAAELLDDACIRWADRVAFRVPGRDELWSYERVRVESDAIAVGLIAAGIGLGSAVAVLSPNKPEAFIAQLAVLKTGAAYVPLNAKAKLSDWFGLTRATSATGLLFGAEMSVAAQELVEHNQNLAVRFSIGEVDGLTSLEDLVTRHRGAVPPRLPDNSEDPSWIVGSGGTTGVPKAICVPQRALVLQTLALQAHLLDAAPIHLVSAPLTHAAGVLTYPVFLQGGETIVLDGARPGEILAAIEKYSVTQIFMPPTAIYAMLAHPQIGDYDYSSLRYFIYTAAPMSPSKLEEALEVFGPVMAQLYGQAEAPTVCTWFSPAEHVKALNDPSLAHRLSSVGRPSSVASVRVVDDNGDPLPTGETGEIAVKTQLRFIGYIGAPEETAKLEANDGYMRTGDIGHIDADGFVYITDRARDMIITGGFNVFPSNVEKVIWTHPSVEDCAVIGLPHSHWGEAVTAVIELKPGAEEATEEIMALCHQQLGPVQTPKSVIYDSLPRSAVGKVLKRDLRQKYASG